jgi:hypothetical protein
MREEKDEFMPDYSSLTKADLDELDPREAYWIELTNIARTYNYNKKLMPKSVHDIDVCQESNGECELCGIFDCPDRDMLHYQKLGCPCCSNKTKVIF